MTLHERQGLRGALRHGGRLDGFKEVNDRYGHTVGDRALKAVADALSRRLRSTDTLARSGGDKFGVLLPYAGPDEAAQVAADLALVVSGTEVDVGGLDEGAPGKLQLSVSVGTALLGPGAGPEEDVLAAADRAMYLQKAARKAHPAPGGGGAGGAAGHLPAVRQGAPHSGRREDAR